MDYYWDDELMEMDEEMMDDVWEDEYYYEDNLSRQQGRKKIVDPQTALYRAADRYAAMYPAYADVI